MSEFPKVFDSSIMADLKSCPQLYNYRHIQNWKPKEPSVHLHAGASFATGIEKARKAFYVDNHSPEDSVAIGLEALLTAYGDFECPADSAKSAQRMAGALEFYFSRYPLSEQDSNGNLCGPITLADGKRAIEFNFTHPLPISHPETGEPLLVTGRMDALLNYAGGVFICDEKTTTQLGASWSRQWDLRGQFTGYTWGCRTSGIRVDGAIVRGVSILKSKYDTQEAVSYRPEWQVERWYEEFLDWIGEAIRWWKSGKYRHNLDHTCAEYGGCAFRTACCSKEPEAWLETYFERRKWDPVTRTETKL